MSQEGGGRPQAWLKCLEWVHILLDKTPERLLEPTLRHRLMEAVLNTLRRPDEEVAIAGLRLIT
eukprot:CAMPEP_0206632812 /NCGR_PEP_ID=MMETSP0325_2-20121206/69120_1 /ASSEMBLY_ACC=CAM_ASM_000347 /TAXON_ID=2866 /ORGANISM="Crypthecodinium cohnii, Strain Seligo" /LENGTH=63 /DNA_ID=CAMNT_0054158391 /DNA_START=1 /DNA_END=188 /DNA_ORIENTATION=-